MQPLPSDFDQDSALGGNRPAVGGDPNANMLGFINQNKFVVIACLVLGTAAGTLYAFRQTPVYAASAKIHIDRREATKFVRGADLSEGTFGYDYVVTQSEILTSKEMISRSIRLGNLDSLACFTERLGGLNLEDTNERNQAIDLVAALIQMNLTVRQLMKDNKPTQLLDLQVKGATPGDCTRILDSLIQAFEQFHRERQKYVAKEVLDSLFKNKKDLETELANVIRELDERRRKDKIISTNSSVAEQRYQALGGMVVTLEQERNEAENLYNTVKRIKQANPEARELLESLYSFHTGGRTPEFGASKFDPTRKIEISSDIEQLQNNLRELLVTQGPKNPTVEALKRQEETLTKKLQQYEASERAFNIARVDTLVEAARIRYEEINNKYQRVKEEFEAARNDSLDYAIKLANFMTLEFDRKRTTETLLAVIESIKSVKVTEDYDSLRITPMERPTSIGQVEPKTVRVALIWGLAGTILGVGIAYLISILDNSIRSPEELQELTGAALLGVVPVIDNRRGLAYPTSGRWVETHTRSGEAEAYRSVRTALHFGRATRAAKCLLVTSPTQGDGKSTTCANLATSMAQNGQRVLLVEADLRRPVLHKIYELDPQIGITSALTGNAAIEDVIIRTPIHNLDIVPAGPIPPNPAELLSSPEFDKFIKRARETYDRVLIDSPPALLVADANVLVSRVDGTLLVINGDRATKRSVVETVRTVHSVGGRVAGVVINMVDPREQRYYQYYYYGSYYNNYYMRRSDTTAPPPPVVMSSRATTAAAPDGPAPIAQDVDSNEPRA